MGVVNEFLNRIKLLLDKEPSDDDFDDFNDLECWFLDNAETLEDENMEICYLGDLVQDEIAEMSYMGDNTMYRWNIEKIYNEMKKLI